MARPYRPAAPFDVAFKILKVKTTTVTKGVPVKTYQDPTSKTEDPQPVTFFGSFRTFGGTESVVNGVLVTYDTATIDTWWRSDITAADRIYMIQTGETYEIIATPENIGMRRQYMQLKVRRIGGTV